jgi:hypothetical protein
MRRSGSIAAIVLTLMALCPGPTVAEEEVPASIERCREFCARVYSPESDDYDECATACREAESCHSSCKDKFGDDKPKVQSCLRICMRRNEKPAAPSAQPAVEL